MCHAGMTDVPGRRAAERRSPRPTGRRRAKSGPPARARRTQAARHCRRRRPRPMWQRARRRRPRRAETPRARRCACRHTCMMEPSGNVTISSRRGAESEQASNSRALSGGGACAVCYVQKKQRRVDIVPRAHVAREALRERAHRAFGHRRRQRRLRLAENTAATLA